MLTARAGVPDHADQTRATVVLRDAASRSWPSCRSNHAGATLSAAQTVGALAPDKSAAVKPRHCLAAAAGRALSRVEVMGGGSILAGLFSARSASRHRAGFHEASALRARRRRDEPIRFMHGEAVGIGGGLGVTPGVAFAYLVMAAVCMRWAEPATASLTARIMMICRWPHRRSRRLYFSLARLFAGRGLG